MKPDNLSKTTRNYSVSKYSPAGLVTEKVSVVVEQPFRILINEEALATVMLTPSALEDFFTGFLFGQGLITDINQIERTLIEREKGLLWAQVSEPLSQDVTKTIITSGCTGGVTLDNFNDLKPLKKQALPDAGLLARLMKEMLAAAQIYRESGGVHSAALAGTEGVICVAEDIGRHNAIDKVIGFMIRRQIKPENKIILTSGRISMEAAIKAARTGISTLASRTAPTSLAIDMAKKLNLNVCGYLKANTLTVY